MQVRCNMLPPFAGSGCAVQNENIFVTGHINEYKNRAAHYNIFLNVWKKFPWMKEKTLAGNFILDGMLYTIYGERLNLNNTSKGWHQWLPSINSKYMSYIYSNKLGLSSYNDKLHHANSVVTVGGRVYGVTPWRMLSFNPATDISWKPLSKMNKTRERGRCTVTDGKRNIWVIGKS